MMMSKAFQALSAGAQMLYLCMALESGGRRDFIFPLAAAVKKYGLSQRSFRRYVNDLAEAGFIEKTSMANLRAPNEYTFSLRWKEEMPP